MIHLVCACGHAWAWHRHHRPGSDCSRGHGLTQSVGWTFGTGACLCDRFRPRLRWRRR